MPWAHARTLAAVRAAAGHVEGADDVELVLLEGIDVGLGGDAGIRVVKHALDARAGRADVAAGVAADALGKLAAPEGVALLGGLFLQFAHGGKAVALGHLAAGFVVDDFIGDGEVLALAELALHAQAVLALHALAAHAQHVDVLALDAVFAQELVEAQGIAGLDQRQRLALHFGDLDQFLGEVGRAEFVVDQFVDVALFKQGGGALVIELALFPAQNALHFAGGEELFCARDDFFSYCLHLRSSSFTFSPNSWMVAAKSFMTLAKRAPSAAETHSTRTRRRSTPR